MPTLGGDSGCVAWLRDLFRTIAEQGCTFLVSGHALSEVQQSEDDVVFEAWRSAGVPALLVCG